MDSTVVDKEVSNSVVFFDGVCNLCNSSVQVILKNDPKKHYRFASLQSEHAKEALPEDLIDEANLQSLVLKRHDVILTRSSAALNIARRMSGLWPLLFIFIIVPKPIRDAVYAYIAKNRYKWFGKKDQCMLPSPEFANRFLD